MSVRKAYPTFEIIKPVCSQGHEISPLCYYINARESFEAYCNELGLHDELKEKLMKIMNFKEGIERQKMVDGLKNCCLLNVRYGGTLSISVIQDNLEDQAFSERKYPEALPGPHSRGDRIYWA